jgi:hypothetical protein
LIVYGKIHGPVRFEFRGESFEVPPLGSAEIPDSAWPFLVAMGTLVSQEPLPQRAAPVALDMNAPSGASAKKKKD